MAPTAFTLRDEYAGSVTQYLTVADEKNGNGLEVPAFTGGVIAVGDSDVNVRELLDEGNGVIVVDEGNLELISALDEYPALKRTETPDGAEVIGGYDDQTASVLKDELERRGIVGHRSSAKPELIAALERLDELAADGENIEPDTSITDLMAEPQGAGDETGDEGTGA